MRREIGAVTVRLVVVGASTAAVLLNGCVARRWDGCATTGAIVGALAAGIAADSADRSNHGAAVAGAALGGMAIAAVLAHAICDPAIEPRPEALPPPAAPPLVPPPVAAPPVEPPPPPPPPPLAKVVITDEQLVTLEPVYFDHGAATIRSVSYPVLDAIVRTLNDRPGMQVRVEGHTDSKGASAYNERLSRRRAVAVVRYLVAKGINPERLEAVSLGASRPMGPNENPDGSDNPLGRAKNRRTEFHVRQ